MNKDVCFDLEKILNYNFKNKDLLLTALTHSSYYNENRAERPCNERLEFLGDAVLSLISAEFLYDCVEEDEGYLSKTRAILVCEEALCEYAKKINLGDYMFFGKGEVNQGKLRSSTISDAVEAVLAALYIDGGKEAAKAFIMPFIIEKYQTIREIKDYKTALQEIVQKNKGEKLFYVLISESGPAHDRSFTCSVMINSNDIAHGEGKSKKAAEQEAAKNALLLMGVSL